MTDDNLSDYGRLTAMQNELKKLRASSNDDCLRNRCTIVIENLELWKKNPDDTALKIQTEKNIADLARYRASKGSE